MWPVLFTLPESLPILGGVPVQTFGVLLFLGFLAAGWLARNEMARKGLEAQRMWDIVVWAMAGGLIGSKVYSLLSEPRALLSDPLGFLTSSSGFTYYGGLILAIVFVWLYMRRKGLPVGETFDCIGVGMPLGVALGRLACFMAGDDYGAPTAAPWGVRFPRGAPPTTVEKLHERFGVEVPAELVERFGNVIPVHPTQLYEATLSLVVLALVWRWRAHPHRGGWLFAVWLGGYGASRFLVETIRLKNDRILFDTFTVAQVISVLLMTTCLVLTRRLRRTSTPAVTSAAWDESRPFSPRPGG